MFSLATVILCILLNDGTFPRASAGGNHDKESLPVLLMLPFPDPRADSGWDRGLELLPAARVAAKEINNMTSLLPGYRLDLIERRSDACGRSLSTIGLTNFVDWVFGTALDRPVNPIATMGLACSTVVTTISPIAGRDQVNLMQVVMANSHILRNQTRFRHLWRVISAVSVNINATLSLMNRFNWTRVAQLYDGDGVFFRGSADVFRETVQSNSKYELVLDQAIEADSSFIDTAIDLIQSNGARIIFVSATVPEAQLLICAAAKKNIVWPGYVWIIHSRTAGDLIDPKCTLEREKLVQAIENVTLLDLSLDGRQEDEELVSGRTYGEYRAAYSKELEYIYTEFESDLAGGYELVDNNPFANAMYDEVWALALALNSSLPELHSKSISLSNYDSVNRIRITEIVEQHLSNMSFEGAVSKIKFNSLREAPTPVTLFHVRNGTAVQIGRYDESTGILKLFNISEDSFPTDGFVVKYNFIEFELAVTYFVLAGLTAVFITVMAISMFVLYNSPEVRAASPGLSMLMFIGCYLYVINAIVINVRRGFPISEKYFTVLCTVDRWAVETAVCLIGFTVLFRLIRVYKLFNGFGKLSKYWHDGWLACYIILSSLVPTALYIIRAFISPFMYRTLDEIRNMDNPPTIISTRMCYLEMPAVGYLTEGLIGLYVMVCIMLVMFFAFGTRKVNYSDFKDTKKVIVYAYVFSVMTALVYFLWLIFGFSEMANLTAVLVATSSIIEAIAVQSFLFVPKVLPSVINKIRGKEQKTRTIRSHASTFTL